MSDWAARYHWAIRCERHPVNLLAEYQAPPREQWGPGPWQDEPDLVTWTTKAALPGLVWRTPHTGAWCGYAAVSEGHPYFGRPYQQVDHGAYVHRGLTFSGRFEPHETCWWLGFDCGHYDDFMPALEAVLRDVRHPRHWARFAAEGRPVPEAFVTLGGTYRDLDYVRAEVESFARELVAAASGKAALDEALSTKAEENQ